MSKQLCITLPSEQATWTREQVEKYLANRGPESVFGTDALHEWASKVGLARPGQQPASIRLPAALVPELAVVTDQSNDVKDMASVYLNVKSGTLTATDSKVMMRTATNDTRLSQDEVVKDITNLESVIPAKANRVAVRFDAHQLLRIVLSALASVGADPTRRKSMAKVTMWVDPDDGEKTVRVEVSSEGDELKLIGAISPMRIDAFCPTKDPHGLKSQEMAAQVAEV